MKTSESKAAYLLFSYKSIDLYSGLVAYVSKKISHGRLMDLHVGTYAVREEIFAERKFREISEFASNLKHHIYKSKFL